MDGGPVHISDFYMQVGVRPIKIVLKDTCGWGGVADPIKKCLKLWPWTSKVPRCHCNYLLSVSIS